MTADSRQLKKRFTGALLALLIAFAAAGTATFAWYIYNTGAHTTSVSMAAGSASSLLISSDYSGEYAYSVPLASSTGRLVPVSTDKLRNGFQHVLEFAAVPGKKDPVAYLFGDAPSKEYYMHTLYLKSMGGDLDVYLSDIGYKNDDESNPISSAVRVGFRVYKPGSTTETEGEYIFEIDPEGRSKNRQYNTSTGEQGYVLDSTARDNSTIKFTPYTPAGYCSIDEKTGEVVITSASRKIASCTGELPVKVDVYIWLEGCDEDCTTSLMASNLREIAIKFAGRSEADNG